jgi:low affinity Fe/Cu permease
MRARFERLSRWTAHVAGSPGAFVASVLVVVLWAATGPLFGWSDTHQLVINTATTIITFWLVFLIQGSQNRDTEDIKRMLKELVRTQPQADDPLLHRPEED